LITLNKMLALTLLILVSITNSSGVPVKSSIARVLTPQELFASSDMVIVGKITNNRLQWGTGEGSRIITVVTVRVDEYQKGGINARMIEIIIPGGTIGDKGVWVEDTPEFQMGEIVHLYLISTGFTPWGALPRYRLTDRTLPLSVDYNHSVGPAFSNFWLIGEPITSSFEDIVTPIILFTLSASLLIMGFNKRE